MNPKTNKVTKTIKAGTTPNGVVYAFGALWVADLGGGKLLKVDVHKNSVVKRYAIPKADWITPSPDALWVSSEDGNVYRFDPSAGKVVAKVAVGANPLGSAWINGELWVPNIDDSTLSIVDPTKNAVRTTLATGESPLSIASAAGDVWISVSDDGEVWRVRPVQ